MLLKKKSKTKIDRKDYVCFLQELLKARVIMLCDVYRCNVFRMSVHFVALSATLSIARQHEEGVETSPSTTRENVCEYMCVLNIWRC